jgi:ferredoxin/flavodoxin---NADP+ reductase
LPAGAGRALRVGVVGAGPSGLFAAEELLDQLGDGVQVDVIDRLPTPYGLVRYGVAPDHPTIKSVVSTLRGILESDRVRFVGGIKLGEDLAVSDLRRCYDAVIYATGAPRARSLGIPGEHLRGSVSASDLVNWYNGHPDAGASFELDAESVAVLGAGNVALDVGRILTRDYRDLAQTDMPVSVLDNLRRSNVKEVHLIARRGPEFAKYSSKELRELGKVESVDKIICPEDLAAPSPRDLDRAARANLAVFEGWRNESPRAGARKIHLRFSLRPVEIIGNGRVEQLILERTTVDESGQACGTAEFVAIKVQMVVRAVGYLGVGPSGVPFDEESGRVPNLLGRVVHLDGVTAPGQYVTGWLKRGPSGVIGTNKVDARETVGALIDDCRDLPRPARQSLESVLQHAGRRWTTYGGWQNIDRAELARGRAEGRARSKIADWCELNDIAMNVRADMSPIDGS